MACIQNFYNSARVSHNIYLFVEVKFYLGTKIQNILAKNGAVVVPGDGWCDSLSKSTKFCIYTFMEKSTNAIICSETMDKWEVKIHPLT